MGSQNSWKFNGWFSQAIPSQLCMAVYLVPLLKHARSQESPDERKTEAETNKWTNSEEDLDRDQKKI